MENKGNNEYVYRIRNNNVKKTNIKSSNKINKRQLAYFHKKEIENQISDNKHIYYNENYNSNLNKKDAVADFYSNIFLKSFNLNKVHKSIISNGYVQVEIEKNIGNLIKSYRHSNIIRRFNLNKDKKSYSFREIGEDVTKEYASFSNIPHINKQYMTSKYSFIFGNKNLVDSRNILKEVNIIKNIEGLNDYANSGVKDAKNEGELYIYSYENNVLKKSFKIANENHNYTTSRLFSIIGYLQNMINSNVYAFNKAKNKSNNNIFNITKNIKNITLGSEELNEIISSYNINKVNISTNANFKYYTLENLQEDNLINNVYRKNFKQIEKRVKSNNWSIDKQQKNHLDIYIGNYIQNMNKNMKYRFNAYIQNKKSLNLINNSYLNEVVNKARLSNIDNNYQDYNKKSNYQNIMENAFLRSDDIKLSNFIRTKKHLRNKKFYIDESIPIDNDLFISNDYKSYNLLGNNSILTVLSENYFVKKDLHKLNKNKNYNKTRIEKSNITHKKTPIQAFHHNLNNNKLDKEASIAERTINIPLTNNNNSLSSFVEKREYINDKSHMNIYSKVQINKQDKEYIDPSLVKKNDHNYTKLEDRDSSNLVLVHKYKNDTSIQENTNSENSIINKENVELRNNVENNDIDIMQSMTNIDTDSTNINNNDKDNKELDFEKLVERMYKDVYRKIEKRLLSEKRRLGL